ncbi:dual specificity protein phosphatase 21 isoform X1 [Capricornis sumatraensis]|uniref:dual specificity protein phosphatase 21 isoform X1 n=1 Tax=Capricornis sumatraensis TaxID=34865 RepID=UPI003604775A
MATPLCPFPIQAVRQPAAHGLSQITKSLFLSNAVAAKDKAMLSTNHITTIISVSVEATDTSFEDIQYVKLPLADGPNSRLYEFFDFVADHIHSVEMKQGQTLLHCAAGVSRSATFCLAYLMKYHSMSLLDAHMWTKSCRPIIRPNNGFWEQLIHYEFKLFGKNTVHMISSSMGMIPDVYEKEICLMKLMGVIPDSS